jgi:hypothetical protein
VLPYFIANLLAIYFIFIGYRYKFNDTALKATFVLAAIPLIIIAGFKHGKVGTDSGTYIWYFNHTKTLTDLSQRIVEQGESGYWFLNFLGHEFTDNYFILFTLSAIIITSCYFYSLKTFNLKTLSLFTLLFIGPYYFQLNGNRQAIAIAIFSVSVIFIIKKQPIRFITSIRVGFLFHKSMVICLPLYLIFKGEIKARKVAIIICSFVFLLVFFQSFINIASSVDPRYSSYGDQQDARGGVVVSSFNVLILIWFVLCRKINPHILATKTYDTLLVIYLLGALISILSVVLGINPSGFLRMSWYFIQMNIFLLPMTILSFRNSSTRYVIILFAVLLMTLYFYLTTSTFSNLTPYRFNPIVEIHNES